MGDPVKSVWKFSCSALQFKPTSTVIIWAESKDTRSTAVQENVTRTFLFLFKVLKDCFKMQPC